MSRTYDLVVSGTKMTIVGPDSIAEGGSADYTITLVDTTNAGVGSVPVAMSFDQGTVSPTTVTTGTNGQATVTVRSTSAGPTGKLTASGASGSAPRSRSPS